MSEGRTLRVVVVDDDELQLRAHLRSARRERAFELRVANNAIDGLLLIGTTKPDLVVMDVFMPGLDGVEACRRLRENPATRDTRVIVASMGMTAELAAVARVAGAAAAVSKPFDIKQLITPKQPADAEPA